MDFTQLPEGREAPGPTQRKILAAALELFAEHGYEGARTRAIARRAGVTEKTLFSHFPSKRDLFVRTVYPAFLNLVQPLAFATLEDAIGRGGGDFRERLAAIVRDRLAFMRDYPDQFKLIAQQLLLDPEFRKAFIAFWRSRILPGMQPVLEGARSAGEVRNLSDETLLRAVISTVIGYAFQRTILDPEAERSDDEDIDTLIDVLMNGLGPA